jgi:hypothetical protein
VSLVFLADSVFVLHGAFAVLVAPSALLALIGRYSCRSVLWSLHNLSITVMVSGQLLLLHRLVCPLRCGSSDRHHAAAWVCHGALSRHSSGQPRSASAALALWHGQKGIV